MSARCCGTGRDRSAQTALKARMVASPLVGLARVLLPGWIRTNESRLSKWCHSVYRATLMNMTRVCSAGVANRKATRREQRVSVDSGAADAPAIALEQEFEAAAVDIEVRHVVRLRHRPLGRTQTPSQVPSLQLGAIGRLGGEGPERGRQRPASRVGSEILGGSGQMVRVPQVVVVEKAHPFRSRPRHTCVACHGLAGMGLLDHPDRVPLKLAGDGAARAVAHHYYLSRGERLVNHTGDGLGQVGRSPISGDHNRKVRHAKT